MADRESADPWASAELKTLFRSFGAPTESITETATAKSSPPEPPAPRVDLGSADDLSPDGARYEMRSVLGRGGMGEVHLCRDLRIGREVAVKLALPRATASAEARARFLREARIQGQLEHPAIVPVYDLVVLQDGTAYFTMKRVRGVTLASMLGRLQSGVAADAGLTRRRLLTAFGQVCLAIDFAHSRGVIHRDLKPGNIMLGDFGEVYVLDWGLAKVLDVDEELAPQGELVAIDAVQTLDGAVLGTPGYMAPEQLDARCGQVGPHTDVYALGAILFEILTGEPLIPLDGTRLEVLLATVQGVETRASIRAPSADVPPELEDICVRALARDPGERLSSGRALYEAIERFLEGDRDLERRRELSDEHARAAEALLEQAAASGDDVLASQAMQELGRALALNPANDAAKRTMVRLLTEPPKKEPPEVVERMARDDARALRLGAFGNTFLALSWVLYLPIGVWMGVRSWPLVAAVLVPLGLSAVLSYLSARRGTPPESIQLVVIGLTLLAYVALGRAFGPLVLVPGLVGTFAVALQTHPVGRMRQIALALCCVTIAAPVVLEQIGVLPRSYEFVDGGIFIRPQMLELREAPTLTLLVLGSVASAFFPSWFVSRQRDQLSRAERRLHLHAWHLERLVPNDAVPARRGESGASRA